MKLEEMSAEELVSNHERLCEMYFLRDDDIDEELRNSFSEITARITRGEKAIKAMEDLQCCGNCCYIADRRCPKWYTGMLTEATNFFRSFAKWVKENENKDDNFPCLGDCIHINETVICKKCGPDNYLYVPHETDED